jgi:hypothetical protein
MPSACFPTGWCPCCDTSPYDCPKRYEQRNLVRRKKLREPNELSHVAGNADFQCYRSCRGELSGPTCSGGHCHSDATSGARFPPVILRSIQDIFHRRTSDPGRRCGGIWIRGSLETLRREREPIGAVWKCRFASSGSRPQQQRADRRGSGPGEGQGQAWTGVDTSRLEPQTATAEVERPRGDKSIISVEEDSSAPTITRSPRIRHR